LESKTDNEEEDKEESGPDQVCGGRVWDVHSDNEQLEAVNSAKCSSCELGFERVNIVFGCFIIISGCDVKGFYMRL
jgi:hypothetical protein